jgi:2-polyprenyl-3-methyl-5-hydroxy-6-metoxy-1,4-benzoquinol methylase
VNSTNKYFSYRNKGLIKESNRNQLGEREVITLLTVLDIEDKPFGLKGKTIADLGSGDQHLRKSLEVRGAEYKGIDIDNCNLEFDQIHGVPFTPTSAKTLCRIFHPETQPSFPSSQIPFQVDHTI